LIIGARNESQLLDNLAAAELELSAEDVARLDEPVTYPYWNHLSPHAIASGPVIWPFWLAVRGSPTKASLKFADAPSRAGERRTSWPAAPGCSWVVPGSAV
jgi:hypothetical protein